MQLSNTTNYAIAFIRALTDEPQTVESLSKKLDIRYEFLQQISLRLRRAGLVRSCRGQGGGIVRALREVSLLDVTDVISDTREPFYKCDLNDRIRSAASEIRVV